MLQPPKHPPKSALAMPIPNFDGLWCIILKILTEKGDHVASQGVLHITIDILNFTTGLETEVTHVTSLYKFPM